MKITMMLADSAQAVGGKLYILGGGWSIAGPGLFPSSIAALIQVPWDKTNEKHKFTLKVVDTDEHPLMVPTPLGEKPLELSGEFEVGRPAGLKKGSTVDVPLALNLGPLPFRPGTQYLWRLIIDDDLKDSADVAFFIRENPVLPA